MVAQLAAPPTPLSLATVDDGEMTLHLHRGQQRAWVSRKRFVCVIAGSQSGKTSFGPHWLLDEIRREGPGDYLVATPTFPLLEAKALPEFRRLFEHQLHLGIYKASPTRTFQFSPEGERRIFGAVQDVPTIVRFGYAADPDSLESMTAKGAWLDEAGQRTFKLASWEAIQRRLALHQGRALLTTTPYSLGWLYDLIWLPWEQANGNHPDIDVINFDSTQNPAFSRAEYDRIQKTMQEWKFDMFYRGRFTRPAGMIYGCFDRKRHVVPRFAIPDAWSRFLGLDFGGVNTAGIFWAKELSPAGQPTGRYFGYREYKAGDRTAKEHVAHLLKDEPRMPTAYGGSWSEGQWRNEFSAAGLAVSKPRIADVEVGIERVYAGIKTDMFILFDDLIGTIDQLGTYSRPVDEHGEPMEGIVDKEQYHYLDAWRYIAIPLVDGLDGQLVY
jgi:hypothetical protein